MDSPYQERVIDHYRNPRNQGVLADPDLSAELDNPVCGDVVRIDVRLEDGRVAEARWSGRGCVISLAAASLLTQDLLGRSVEDLHALQDTDVFGMLGFRPGPVRSRCALLPLRALQAGLVQIEG
jgi:nitrogen fixation NifU-like protein